MNTKIDNLIDEMVKKEFEKAKKAVEEERYSEILPEIIRFAEKDMVDAQFLLAMIYGHGLDVERDDEKYLHWLRRAAFSGNIQAKAWLGSAYINGVGDRLDCIEGIKLLKEAANSKNTGAAFHLAVIYIKGTCVEADANLAKMWCQRAAALGNRDATVLLHMIEEKNPEIGMRVH